MKNMAQVDQNNIVINITVAQDDWFCEGFIEYNNSNPAGIGYSYNPEEDIFVAPQPYPSWIRNGSFWEAPTPMPTDGQMYRWVEADLNWQAIKTEESE